VPPTEPPSRTGPRWGLRTLGFLTLALASVLLSNLDAADGRSDYALLTFLGTVVGLVGAAWCTVRGIREWTGLNRL
jgi:hypothetical protein